MEQYFIKEVRKNNSKQTLIYLGKVGQVLYWTSILRSLEFVIIITDLDINILSQNSFTVENKVGSGSISDMIVCSNGDLLFCGLYTENDFKYVFALRLSALNEVKWFKSYETTSQQPFLASPARVKGLSEETYLLRSGSKTFFTIDGEGAILNALKDDSRTLTVQDCVIYNEKIILIGVGAFSRQNPGIFSLMSLDYNLDPIVGIEYFSEVSIDTPTGVTRSVILNDNNLIISSNVLDKQYLFSLNLDQEFPDEINTITFEESLSLQKITRSNNSFYKRASDIENNFGIIHKFDLNQNLLWSKKVEGHKTLDVKETVSSDSLIFSSGQNLGKINVDFEDNTCIKSTLLPSLNIEREVIIKRDPPMFPYILNPIEISSIPQSIIKQTINSYEIKQLCPIPQTLNLTNSTITANPIQIDADGDSTTSISVQLKDDTGANITTGGDTVVIRTSEGTIANTIDQGSGRYTAVLTSGTSVATAILSFTVNGEIAPQTANVEFYLNQVTCPAHVAFIIDESGSINGVEPQEIRAGLQSFIDAQLGSNLTVSFIGMSESDTNTRNDHVLQQKVTSTTKATFDDWITRYKNVPISAESDYWASGFDVVNTLSTVPDIVIVIADGLQIQNREVLLQHVKRINNISHLYVYALQIGTYNGGEFNVSSLEQSLNYYLERTPIPSTAPDDILITDYQEGITDFNLLGDALANLNDALVAANVGCGNIAITSTAIDEDIELYVEEEISVLNIGTITLQNDKSVVHTVAEGTQLIAINGITVVATETVSIQANGQGEVPVHLTGTPSLSGEFEEVISVAGVLNPEEFSIAFTVKPRGKIKHTQSPFLYLQAAGSTGEDGSAKGVHLRWAFKNALGENHLPKGNLAANSNGYNKPEDFVKISKVPYEKLQITIDFNTPPVFASMPSRRLRFRRRDPLWVYEVSGNRYVLLFDNVSQYYNTARNIDPRNNPKAFLESYGNNIIEVQTVYSLAFSVEYIVENSLPSSTLQTELIAREERLSTSRKQGLVARQTYTGTQFSSTYQQAEDIKRIRYRANNCVVTGIKIELYATIVEKADKDDLWQDLGSYALTTNTSTAFNYLEPSPGVVDGKWPRFNEGDLVNIDNYKAKWEKVSLGAFEKDIKQIVADYIALSNDQNNPRGEEIIAFGDDDTDAKRIAYVDILNIAASDYHIARMLGLGCFDLDAETETQQFMYVIKYTTKNKIKGYIYDDDNYNIEHIYTSLPTGTTEQRLPRTFDIKRLRPGVPSGESFAEQLDDDGNVTDVVPNLALFDSEGYSANGKSRFVAIYAEEDQEDELLLGFYAKQNQFNTATYTEPVNGGIEVKLTENSGWQPINGAWDKPELSVTLEYFNKTLEGNATPEILPLGIPDPGEPLYVHRQTREGFYTYGTYGINWFSRVSPVAKTLEIETVFVPDNNLLPPHNISALHIVEERPLLLTSRSEQQLLGANTRADKTMVRLAFEYNTTQEIVSYKITDTLEAEAQEQLKDVLVPGDNVLLHPDAVFRDEKEVFANTFDVFFRNELPQNIRGKITAVNNHPTDIRIAVVTTENYRVHSISNADEETFLTPRIPEGSNSQNFVGGVFTTNGTNFFIESVTDAPTGVIINIYKKELDDSIQTNVIPRADVALEGPEIMGDALFMAVENMASPESWGIYSPNSKLHVQFGVGSMLNIHREIIINQEGPDDGPERILEKSRGFWSEASIAPVEEVVDVTYTTVDGEVVANEEKAHKGLYEITMPFRLPQHPQHTPDTVGNFVEWSGGIVRVHTNDDPEGPRKDLKVIRIEHIGSTTNNAVVYAVDDAFSATEIDNDGNAIVNPTIIIGDAVSVNFYPGFKVYLYADADFNLTERSITPDREDLKYSVFGLRSISNTAEALYNKNYRSQVSAPALMFVHRIIEPQQPEKPEGALYATQPDVFGKATYTFDTKFKHEPYAVLMYRSNDRSILGALYTDNTVLEIITALEALHSDAFYTNRWDNLLGFSYDAEFSKFPNTESGYRFPKPDKPSFFALIDSDIQNYNRKYGANEPLLDRDSFNLNTTVLPDFSDALEVFPEKTVTNYVKEAILNTFVSLTEAPLLYNHIRSDSDYIPVNKRQVIRDRHGNLLPPNKPPYDIAPMAKRIGRRGQHYDSVLFTDFLLDGTSKNTYFYAAREVGSTTQLGEFSSIKGPIKLVNTKAPENPEIKRVLPMLGTGDLEYKKLDLAFVDLEHITIGENNRLISSGSLGRAAGLASKQIIRGNAYVTFKVEEGFIGTIGFSKFNSDADRSSIGYGLTILNGILFVTEKEQNPIRVGVHEPNSVFSIEIKGNTIIYMQDTLVLYRLHRSEQLDVVLDVSIYSMNATVYDLELFSAAYTYTEEKIIGQELPLTFATQEFIQINDSIITKISGVNGDAWDAGATTEAYLPYYGNVTYQLKNNTNVIVGLANDIISQDKTHTVDYAILASSDGYLSIHRNGEFLKRGVQYDGNSILEIERRNDYLIFKKNHRPFFELQLESSIPLFTYFSMFDADSEIINLKMQSTTVLARDFQEDTTLPALAFEVNAYQPDQGIRRLNLYRTTRAENTLSIRTMDLVDTVDLVLTNQLDKNVLIIKDEFLDLGYAPYSDTLFYRVTVSRAVEYAKPKDAQEDPTFVVSEHKPSNPSKLLISSIVESTNPKTPEVTYSFDVLENNATVLEHVILKWNKTVHNGKYHVFFMNSQGNWVKIHEVTSNVEDVQVFLGDTDISETLQIETSEGVPKYYHFKVDAENSAGMLNTQSKILTIPSETGLSTEEGIGSMIIENTNLVR